jgi:hypothetical protein
VTSEERKSKLGTHNRKFIAGISSLAVVIIMLSLPYVGATILTPPYYAATGTPAIDYRNYPTIGVFNHWTPPYAYASNGYMGAETDVSFHGVGQSGAIITSTENLQFWGTFTATSTKSYTITWSWSGSTHVRMAVHSNYGMPCNTIGHCIIKVTMNLQNVATGIWVGSDYIVTIADYVCNVNIWSVEVYGALGATSHAWTLTNGQTYRLWAEVTTYESLSSGSYPTSTADAWSRIDIYNSARLPSVSIT